MEVHGHSHSHGKKTWKSYFWEFLMLFLAVFCGFLAEYQLEHKIERERANKYMYDMVENLKYDTIRYNRNIKQNELLGWQLDSFRIEIRQAISSQVNARRLYDLWFRTASFNSVVFNRTAITQLKNSGSFRLIKNDSLASLISDYYERKTIAAEKEEGELRIMSDRLRQSSARFFYYDVFDTLLSSEIRFDQLTLDSIIFQNGRILSKKEDLALLITNAEQLKLLYNDVAMKESALKKYKALLGWARQSAIELLDEIKLQYSIRK